MIWSHLTKQLRSLICEALRARVDSPKATYRKACESAYDRAWITIDGKEAFQLSHGEWTRVLRDAKQAVAAEHPEADAQTQRAHVAAAVEESGVEHTGFLGESLHRYLETPVAESLQSANPII